MLVCEVNWIIIILIKHFFFVIFFSIWPANLVIFCFHSLIFSLNDRRHREDGRNWDQTDVQSPKNLIYLMWNTQNTVSYCNHYKQVPLNPKINFSSGVFQISYFRGGKQNSCCSNPFCVVTFFNICNSSNTSFNIIQHVIDNATILSSHSDPVLSTRFLQQQLRKLPKGMVSKMTLSRVTYPLVYYD